MGFITKKLFVYGTLRRHERYHHLLEGAETLATQCWTPGRLYDTGDGYPAMIPSKEGYVYGELYAVTKKQLGEIDRLEGYRMGADNNEYERVCLTVFTDEGEELAYTYIYPPSNLNTNKHKAISSGDWKCYRLLRQSRLLYFAYGSCMDTERFKQAKVDSLFRSIAGRGILKGFSLRYSLNAADGGRADIVEIGGQVEGKVYRISRKALAYLYQREGVKQKIYRPTFIDVRIDNQLQTNVLTFIVVDKQEESAPPEHYLREIVRGGKDCLSDAYLAQLVNRVQTKFNMDVSFETLSC